MTCILMLFLAGLIWLLVTGHRVHQFQ